MPTGRSGEARRARRHPEIGSSPRLRCVLAVGCAAVENTAGHAAAQEIAAGYATEGAALELGCVVVDGAVDPSARVRIPFATLNRHGLVAGATGTGKTK